MAIFAENGANMEIDLTIEQTGPHEAIPYELLYEADPSREAVADYIARGSCYIARIEGRTVGVSVLLRTRPFTMELVNLCVAEPYRRQGIATRLIAHAAERARAAECRILEVGTGNAGIGQLALYQRCGFRSSRSKRTISSGITRSRSTKTESSAGTWFGSEWNYNRRQPDSTGRRHANGGTGIRGRSGRYAVETASDG